MNRRRLERHLQDLRGFSDPAPGREQYPTPADLAAHLVHLADLQGDLSRSVVDLGAGTGVIAVAAALKGASVVGVEVDADAISVARDNAETAGVEVGWVLGDATRPPVCPPGATVLMNPPFGAQDASIGDRPFLAATAEFAAVSYSVHNAGSRAFVESFAAENGGEVTHAFRADFELERQFEFHDDDARTVETEVYRIEWDQL